MVKFVADAWLRVPMRVDAVISHTGSAAAAVAACQLQFQLSHYRLFAPTNVTSEVASMGPQKKIFWTRYRSPYFTVPS